MLKNSMEGFGNYTYEIVSRLAKLMPNDKIYLFVDRNPDEFKVVHTENVKVVEVFPPARHPILWHIWYEVNLPNAIKKNGIDILFSPDGFCSLNLQVPQIMVVHDLAFWHFREHLPAAQTIYFQHFFPLFLKKTDNIITVSDFTHKDLVKNFPFTNEKTQTILNGYRKVPGVTGENILKKYRLKAGKYLIYIGSLHPRKNIIRMLEAFKIFKNENPSSYKLVVCGRWAWKNNDLKRFLKTYSLKEEVIFTGFLSDNEMFYLLSQSAALIYPSLWEGFGLPLLEAMQYRIPIICSFTSSLPEVGGKGALYFNPYDEISIADAMKKVLLDDSIRKSLIEAGTMQLSHFDWDKSAFAVKEMIENKLTIH